MGDLAVTASSLMAIDNKDWGAIGATNRGQVDAKWEQYKGALLVQLKNKHISESAVNAKCDKIFDKLEDQNYHALNQALEELGFLRCKRS